MKKERMCELRKEMMCELRKEMKDPKKGGY